MNGLERLRNNAVVPVVVLENAKDAVPTARALLAGGIDVMEITLRTPAALESIGAVAAQVPEMLVGAGTVLNAEQAQAVVDAGGRFIVSPGFDEAMVRWCLDRSVTIVPGCVTPSEIMAAVNLGLRVLKFFPANVYGGLAAMKSLSGPFGEVRFIPTGGVNTQNIGEFSAAPFIHTVGGSWVCPKGEIAAGNFEKITALCKEAVAASLGFELAHVGINAGDGAHAAAIAQDFANAFGFALKEGNSSAFAGTGVEVMKSSGPGTNGHVAVRTNSIERAAAWLEGKGLRLDHESEKRKGGRLTAVYLREEIGGFAVHLLQK